MPIIPCLLVFSVAALSFVCGYILDKDVRDEMNSLCGIVSSSVIFSFLFLSLFAVYNWPFKKVELIATVISDKVAVVDINGEAYNVFERISYENAPDKFSVVATIPDDTFGLFLSNYSPNFELKTNK
jgi:hypothetical protein